jgi:hypothetical protein
MPYPASPNASYFALSTIQLLEEVASHELAEAITDPQLNAWYDNALGVSGEIGDLSNLSYSTLNGYVVQNEFSNKTNASMMAAGTNFYISSFQNPTEGQFNDVIATFVDTSGKGNLSSAAVNWGDGSSAYIPLTDNTVKRLNDTTFQLVASHTYKADEGRLYNLDVWLSLSDGSKAHAYGQLNIKGNKYNEKGLVRLTDPPVVGTASNISAVAGTPYTGAVATFIDPSGAEPNDNAHYTATIDWGDNTPVTAGTIRLTGGTFTVGGKHTYQAAGSYSVTCTINHEATVTQVVSSAEVLALADGTLLVATLPSAASPSSPIGIIGVNPLTGEQTPVSTGGLFSLPTYIDEAPDGQVYVSDLHAFGTGAVISVDPNTGQQRLLARGGYLNGPMVLAVVDGYLYVGNEGDGSGAIHNIVQIDPSTGKQRLITEGGGFTILGGMVPAPGNNLYVADDSAPGAIWEVNLDTGKQTLLSQGRLLNYSIDVAVEPSGDLIVVNGGGATNDLAGGVVRVNPHTGAQALVTSFGADAGVDSVEVSGDGTIFVGAISTGNRPGRVYAVDPDTGAQRIVSQDGQMSLVEGMRVFHSPISNGSAAPTHIPPVSGSVGPAPLGAANTEALFAAPMNLMLGEFGGDVANLREERTVFSSHGRERIRATDAHFEGLFWLKAVAAVFTDF